MLYNNYKKFRNLLKKMIYYLKFLQIVFFFNFIVFYYIQYFFLIISFNSQNHLFYYLYHLHLFTFYKLNYNF